MYSVIVHYHIYPSSTHDADVKDSFRDITSIDISDDKKLLTMTYRDGITFIVPLNKNVRLIETQNLEEY